MSSHTRRIQIRAWKKSKTRFDYDPLRLGSVKDERMVPANWPLHPSAFIKPVNLSKEK